MPPFIFPVLLLAHIALALALFVPSLLLPFTFRARRGSLNPERLGGLARTLLAIQARGTTWIGLGLAYFIQVPRLRNLIGLRSGSDPRWPALARRQRYISYVMAGLVGTIGFLMSTKPALW